MNNYTKEELKEALRALSSLISKCEKAQEKLKPATSQHTLMRNRLAALRIASSLTSNELEAEKHKLDSID